MKRFTRSEVPASADAARAGEELRDAREASGLSIQDMSQALRIRRVYLLALEEGRMRDLPSPAYAWGFVRNYSNALGLDPDEMVRRFRDSAGPAVAQRHDLIFPEPVPERGMPTGILVLAGAVLVIGAYIGWSNWSSPPNRTVDAIPAVPPRLERAARVGTAAEPPALAVPGLSGGGNTMPASTVTLPTPVQVPVVVPQPPPPPVVLSPTDVSRITLRFKAESWLQVRAGNQGPPLIARVFRSGESFTPPNQPGLVATIAIAPAVDLLIDGQAITGLINTTAGRQILQLDSVMQRHTQPTRPSPPPPKPYTTTPPASAAPASSAPSSSAPSAAAPSPSAPSPSAPSSSAPSSSAPPPSSTPPRPSGAGAVSGAPAAGAAAPR